MSLFIAHTKVEGKGLNINTCRNFTSLRCVVEFFIAPFERCLGGDGRCAMNAFFAIDLLHIPFVLFRCFPVIMLLFFLLRCFPVIMLPSL